jgi:hypothetical protein
VSGLRARGLTEALLAPLRRLDVVWVAGETSAFAWFIPLLQRFEAEAKDDAELRALLGVSVYLTGRPPESDKGAVLLHFALDAFLADNASDCIIGLEGTHTTPGRPNWPDFFAHARADFLAAQEPGERARAHAATEVFFCGPPVMNAALADACFDAGMAFHTEAY